MEKLCSRLVRKRRSLFPNVVDEPVAEHVVQRCIAQTKHDRRQHHPCAGQLGECGNKRYRLQAG